MATVKKKMIVLPIHFDFPENFTNEPLFKLLRSFKFINQWSVFVILFFVGIMDDLMVGAYLGYWYSTSTVVGVFDVNNIPPLIMSLIVEPGMWAFFVGFPKALRDLINTIEAKNIILTEEKFVKEQVAWLKSRSSANWLKIAALPLTVVITYYAMLIIGEYKPTPWFYLGWHYWLLLFRILGAAYVTVYSVSWSLLALYTLNNVFSKAKIRVNAYDGDNAGGLRFVGEFILMVSRLVLIIVPFLVAETLFAIRLGHGILGQFNLWFEILVLPVLLIIMVLLPLSACRRAMFTAKDEFLNPLRDKILNQVRQTYSLTQTGQSQLTETTALIDFHTKLRREFPTWPFDVSMTQQLGISFFLTFLPVIFNVIFQIAK
jgi:hypothetical protein